MCHGRLCNDRAHEGGTNWAWARVGAMSGWSHDGGVVEVVRAMVVGCWCVHDCVRDRGTSVSNRKKS